MAALAIFHMTLGRDFEAPPFRGSVPPHVAALQSDQNRATDHHPIFIARKAYLWSDIYSILDEVKVQCREFSSLSAWWAM